MFSMVKFERGQPGGLLLQFSNNLWFQHLTYTTFDR